MLSVGLSLALSLVMASQGLVFANTAQAADFFEPRNAQLGSTVEILIPKEDITAISATLDDAPIYFYPIRRLPKFDQPISRAEFLELIFRNSDLPESGTLATVDFPDVPPDHPYYQVVQRAAALGIVSGYEDGLFRPYATMTRGQIAKIMVNAFDSAPMLESAPSFSDMPEGHVFHDFIVRVIRAGLFQGYPDGLMRPNRDINFSEAELVIKRAMSQQNEPSRIFTPLGERDYYRAFAGIHRLSEVKPKNLQLALTRGFSENSKPVTEKKSIRLNITPRSFETVSFSLPAKKTELFGKSEQDTTWDSINKAKSSPNSQQLWKESFTPPTEGELTLGFGDKLYINGAYSGSHFGLDWANEEGTPVRASSTGKVTLAEWTPSYGNTIVIDHGQNIFTMYLHLSELKVKEGDLMATGEVIGLMGSTGIATGSHLHFTHFVGNIIVDSKPWLDGEFK